MFSIECVVASHMSYIHWYPDPFCPVFGVLHSVIKLLQVLVQGCKLPGRFNVLSRDLFWNYGVRCS
jgi:hypothetical protein